MNAMVELPAFLRGKYGYHPYDEERNMCKIIVAPDSDTWGGVVDRMAKVANATPNSGWKFKPAFVCINFSHDPMPSDQIVAESGIDAASDCLVVHGTWHVCGNKRGRAISVSSSCSPTSSTTSSSSSAGAASSPSPPPSPPSASPKKKLRRRWSAGSLEESSQGPDQQPEQASSSLH